MVTWPRRPLPPDLAVRFSGDAVLQQAEPHAAGLEVIQQQVGCARADPAFTTSSPRPRGPTAGPTPKDIRAWAVAPELEINFRGRIPESIVQQELAGN